MDELIPAAIRASFESSSGKFVLDPASGVVTAAIRGVNLARIGTRPPSFAWAEPRFGALLRMLLQYTRWTRMLQDNRGFDTLSLRTELREKLDGAALLANAELAGCRVRKHGGLVAREYDLIHHAIGPFVNFRVLRGQRHVVDLTWLGSNLYEPLELLATIEAKGIAGPESR
ncbi:MAG: hypothetical protein HYX57_04990 [Chloroflexi bacterium]|nr:hypothetical protein [Chloroflexota bacterium]